MFNANTCELLIAHEVEVENYESLLKLLDAWRVNNRDRGLEAVEVLEVEERGKFKRVKIRAFGSKDVLEAIGASLLKIELERRSTRTEELAGDHKFRSWRVVAKE